MPGAQQPLAHVRADEAGRPGHADSHAGFLSGRAREQRAAAAAERAAPGSPCRPAARRSERRVRKRRCGESGSKRRSKPPAAIASAVARPCAGVVTASTPDGRSTRRASERRSCTSRTCSSVSAQSTRSKRRVGERQRSVGGQLHVRGLRHAASGTRQRHRGHVGQRQLARPQLHRQAAVSAAEVESAVHRVERAHEGGQVLRRGRPVVGHQLPELVVVATGYQAPFALITAGTVFSRIERSRKTDQCSR